MFFVLISLNVIPALGLKTQLPSAGSAAAETAESDRHAGADEQLQLDGEPIALDALVNTLKQQQQANQTTTIIVNSDKGVAVERLVAVMDNLRQGGFLSVSIATRKL